jgi:hypothetical protein
MEFFGGKEREREGEEGGLTVWRNASACVEEEDEMLL